MKIKNFAAAALSVLVMGGTLPAAALAAPSFSAVAESYAVEGPLGFRIFDDRAEIYKCDPSAEGVITIPSEINGVPVAIICKEAFFNIKGITGVEIPDSITFIDEFAFSACESLTSVVIPDSVTAIGGGAFTYCTKLSSVTLPAGLTSISASTFSGCTALHEITLPDSLETISTLAFSGSGLTSVTLPDSVKSVGKSAFSECGMLNSVIISNAQCDIFNNGSTFSTGTDGGTPFFLGTIFGREDSTAHTYADTYGYNFSVYAEDGCILADEGAYSFRVYSDHAELYKCDPAIMGLIRIPETVNGVPVTLIDEEVFMNNSKITGVKIPETVEKIGKFAFAACTGLESVTIPNSVTVIDGAAFTGCTSLKSLELSDSLTEIGASAFSLCTALENIRIPGTVRTIGARAFQDCNGLTQITIPVSVESIGKYAFELCNSLLSISILNPDCEIFDDGGTISTSAEGSNYSFIGTICGYPDSTAQAYAEKYGYVFSPIDLSDVTYGDVNNDGSVNLNDAVAVLQFVSLSTKYPLDARGKEAADVFDNGTSGINGNDALAIMMVDAGTLLQEQLPVTGEKMPES